MNEGTDVALLSIGTMGQIALEVAKESSYSVGVYNMRFLKPLDCELLEHVLARYKNIITIEDGTIEGGLGSAVAEYIAEKGICGVELKRVGIPDRFVEHGTTKELFAECGMDKQSILVDIDRLMKRTEL